MSNWNPKANDIFLQAIEITAPEERGRFLDEACAANLALRAQVEALIRSHEQAGEFLGRPILEPMACTGPGGDATRTGPSTAYDVSLDFLAPSDKSGSLGRLGHYEVQAVVGRGGMGVVLKAFDENLHRVVAIKVMAPQLATVATARARFTREARAQAAIAHEHVVTIHAVEEANGLPYIVMQYVAGVSLQDRLDRTGPLRLHEVLRIGVQAAAGLAAAHKQGLVHRDVKPANILLENGVERVKITDFGLARAADDASLTASGQVAGTPMYMSPEQAEGKPIDVRSDLFSLGSVLYALCAGRPPFRAASTMAVLKRVCEDTPTPVREVNPEVPDWLADVIAKLHAKNPAERFQSADEVADALEGMLARVQRPSGAVDRPAAPRARRGRRWVGAAAVLALLATGLAITEATGVTRLRGGVVRVFTPADPSVVEGGPTEPVQPADVPVVDSRPFVVLGGRGVLERTFDTLADAVQHAGNGDTIEVRGNGPFVSRAIPLIQGQRLTIRAGAGARPVFRWERVPSSPPYKQTNFLSTDSNLVLEGLEFQVLPPPHPSGPGVAFIGSLIGGPAWGTSSRVADSIRVANCRFVLLPPSGNPNLVLIDVSALVGVVRNCEFVGHQGQQFVSASNVLCKQSQLIVMDNCAIAASYYPLFVLNRVPDQISRVRLTHNTFTGMGSNGSPVGSVFGLSTDQRPAAFKGKVFDVEASENVFDARSLLYVNHYSKDPLVEKQADGEQLFRDLLDWKERANLYDDATGFSTATVRNMNMAHFEFKMNLKGWSDFCGAAAIESRQGRVLLAGGNLGSRLKTRPEVITGGDFRLRDDCVGKGAGRGGKDLGADIDLVGPGSAYERWKKTPEYQQWLKDSGQALVVVPQARDRPFVILGGGKGAADRTFPTLAEAVQAAAHRDTVEVRGDGPFVSAAIPPISGRRLTIRAAAGARPVLCWNGDGGSEIYPSRTAFLSTDVDLAVEGLEFQAVSSLPVKLVGSLLQVTNGGTVWIANCRFRSHLLPYSPGSQTLFGIRAWEASCVVRNSSFFGFNHGAVQSTMAARMPQGKSLARRG